MQDSLIRERAGFARAIEYIREDSYDDEINEKLDRIQGSVSTPEDFKDANDIVDRMPPEDDGEEPEIEKIIHADKDMSFDKMIGICDDDQCCDSCDPEKKECGNCATEEKQGQNLEQETRSSIVQMRDKVNESIEESATEKYIDVLDAAANRLVELAPMWDENPSHSYMMENLVIESVNETDSEIFMTIQHKPTFFDDKTISITQKKDDGSVTVRF